MKYQHILDRWQKSMKWKVIGRGFLIFTFLMMIFGTLGCDKAGKQDAGEEGEIKAVKVMNVAAGENTVSLKYIGTVDAEELVKYSFKTAGQINKIYVSLEDRVTKGDPLAELDTTDLDYQLSIAKATMDTAKVNVGKAKDASDYAESLYKKQRPCIKMV